LHGSRPAFCSRLSGPKKGGDLRLARAGNV
jgi:hypothetical protein